MLCALSAAWVTGVNDVVSFVQAPLVVPDLWVWIETCFLSSRLALANAQVLGFSCGCSKTQNQTDLLPWMPCDFCLCQNVCGLLETKNKDKG